MSKTAEIYGINGPVIYLKGNTGFKMSEMVYVGKENLVYGYCSDNADDAPIGDKRIRIDATNWVIYNTIKEELE